MVRGTLAANPVGLSMSKTIDRPTNITNGQTLVARRRTQIREIAVPTTHEKPTNVSPQHGQKLWESNKFVKRTPALVQFAEFLIKAVYFPLLCELLHFRLCTLLKLVKHLPREAMFSLMCSTRLCEQNCSVEIEEFGCTRFHANS